MTRDGHSYLLGHIADLKRKLTLARQESRRQRLRAELWRQRAAEARKPRRMREPW